MWSWGVSLEFIFQELLLQSASILVRIVIFCASIQTATTVRSLQLCRSETHLNLAPGNWLFRCGTFHLKCRLTSSEVFGWAWTDSICWGHFRIHPDAFVSSATIQWQPYVVLVQDGLGLICQHHVISLAFPSFFLFLFGQTWPGFEHRGGALVKPAVIGWRWQRPTYLLDLANCCEGVFLGFLSISHTALPALTALMALLSSPVHSSWGCR